jgi:hypothetical protein
MGLTKVIRGIVKSLFLFKGVFTMSAKQDRTPARTPSALEQKYGFGKTFAEILGIAENAEATAEDIKKAIEGLDQTAIFNLLTNNGESQGIFRGDDGNIYINAAYIVSLSELFAKDIEMSGKFTNTAEVFLLPGDEEIETVRNHIEGISFIPSDRKHLYDFDNNGKVDSFDYMIIRRAALGTYSLDTWSGAVKSTVTVTIDLLDTSKIIRIHGTNMWGREVDTYISANAIQSTFVPRSYLDNLLMMNEEKLFRKVNGVTEWLNPPMNEGTEYRTIERWSGKAVYTKLINLGRTVAEKTESVTIDSGITNLIRAVPNLSSALSNCVGGEFEYHIERITDTTINCYYKVPSTHVGQKLYVQIWYTAD